MARIRTIKPEFPQSQSMSRCSRDARLAFVLLWPQCDDHGKFRAASRMLASVLFPYDDDAPSLIDGWLGELENVGAIQRYSVDGNDYIKILNWLDHQKVDKPSASRFPDPQELPRSLANIRERSSEDQGPGTKEGTKDQGPGGEGTGGALAPSPTAEAVEIFNAQAAEHDWPQVQVLNTQRKRALEGCLKAVGALEGWQTLLAKVVASDFLMGRTRRSDEHENWRFDFDFLVKPKRYIKLMEGGYDNATNKHKPQSGLGAALTGLAD